MINIRKLESELWESADLLRAGSNLTSNQYYMPVLGLIFLRYAYSRYKMVEAEILKGRPSRGGRVMPVEASDFAAKSALYIPKESQYDYLLNQRVAKIESDYPCYAYYLFSSKKMFHDVNNLANGAAQQNLSPIRTGQIQILKLSEEVPMMFEEMTKPLIDKKISLNKSTINAAQARDRLLPKLMGGEIEV